MTLSLPQNFQDIDGIIKGKGNTGPIVEAQLWGDLIDFTWQNRHYSRQAGPDGIHGRIESQNGEADWNATMVLQDGK